MSLMSAQLDHLITPRPDQFRFKLSSITVIGDIIFSIESHQDHYPFPMGNFAEIAVTVVDNVIVIVFVFSFVSGCLLL